MKRMVAAILVAVLVGCGGGNSHSDRGGTGGGNPPPPRQARFISQGDDSGTHKKERELWRQAGVASESHPWYVEVGQGMGATAQIAKAKQAYTLIDRGTYLAYQQALDLIIVHQGDPVCTNPYSVIAVNPQRHPHVNQALARAFIHWLLSPAGQQRIGSYRKQGQVLFHPRTLRRAP